MLGRYDLQQNKAFGSSRRSTNDDGVVLNRQVEEYEKKFLDWLVGMHNALGKDMISVDEIRNITDFLQHIKKEQTDDYFEALVRPEWAKGAKIPSQVPVPSSSFQLHSQVTVAPNASGNAFIIFNPFYLAASNAVPIVQNLSSFFVNNNAGLTGGTTAPANTTLAQPIGQLIPSVYNQYRLVSASIVVKYIGRLDIVQGTIGGAIIFDPLVTNQATGTANPFLDKYGDFNLAQDSYYFQENLTLNGMRELFFPLDNTYEQYQNIGTAKNGFSYMIYIQDGVPTSANYKVDIYCNYEALADVGFLNYIPQSQCTPIPQTRKDEFIRAVQVNPITSASVERPNKMASSVGFWDRVKNTLGDYLPSLASLSSMIPGVGKVLGPVLQAGSSFLSRDKQSEAANGSMNESWLKGL